MIKDGKLVWLPAVHKQSVYFIFFYFLCNICTVLVLNIFQLCWEYSICSVFFLQMRVTVISEQFIWLLIAVFVGKNL